MCQRAEVAKPKLGNVFSPAQWTDHPETWFSVYQDVSLTWTYGKWFRTNRLKMLEIGIITEFHSDWNSLFVFVPKVYSRTVLFCVGVHKQKAAIQCLVTSSWTRCFNWPWIILRGIGRFLYCQKWLSPSCLDYTNVELLQGLPNWVLQAYCVNAVCEGSPQILISTLVSKLPMCHGEVCHQTDNTAMIPVCPKRI